MDPTRTSWPAVLLALGAGVGAAFQVGKAPIALPFLRPELGLDLSAASWVLSILALLGAVAGGIMGSLITRLGARRMLPFGLLLLSAASLAGGVAPNFPLLLLSRAVEGVGLMVVVIAAPALITLLTRQEDRAVAFGLWACFMPFGVSVAMMTAPALPVLGWRGLWLVMAGLLAVYAVLVHILMPHPQAPPQAENGHLGADLWRTMTSAGPIQLATIFICYTTAYMALTGFLPTLLIERMGVSPGTAGLMTAAVAGANILGNLLTGPLLRLGVPRWLPILFAAMVIGASSYWIFDPQVPAATAYGLSLAFSAFGGLLPGCVLGGAALLAPERRLVPVTLGLAMQGSNIGQMLGPALVGAAVTAAGWGAARWVLIPITAVGIMLTLVLRRTLKAS